MGARRVSLENYLKRAHSGEANEGQCSSVVFTEIIGERLQRGQVQVEDEALNEALEDDTG